MIALQVFPDWPGLASMAPFFRGVRKAGCRQFHFTAASVSCVPKRQQNRQTYVMPVTAFVIGDFPYEALSFEGSRPCDQFFTGMAR